MRNFAKLFAAAALICACGGQAPTIPSDEQFVTVQKDAPTGAKTTGANDNTSFYLAINKSELGKKYFFSAYLSQFFPGAVGSGAAQSMGTRVVSFEVQNGKLFVFDASNLHEDSNTFNPSLIIDAYPIVEGLLTGTNAKNYVVFDPAQGISQFSLLRDAFSGGGVKFNIDLSYLSRFRKIADGVTFDQVFMGYADMANPNAPLGTENNTFRASGTLGIALRRYSEGAGFTPGALFSKPYYFIGDLALVPNSGNITSQSIHWNIKPGMKPIKWLISNKVLNSQKLYPEYDAVGALKAGIEGWNQVLGFKVVEAAVATDADDFGDDDTNYVVWDEDPTFGAAFANWRNNPNTGEIRGASVYINSLWLADGDAYFNPNHQSKVRSNGVPDLLAAPLPAARPAIPTLTWLGIQEKPLCLMFAPGQRVSDGNFAKSLIATDTTMTPKQKVEAFLTHVILHEIGHTLGLRHNFMGSLMPPSSSVMDYLDNDTSILMTSPGVYDVDAIKLLYGQATTEPQEPFCTDEDTVVDPHCNRFDYPGDPMTVTYIPTYQTFLNQFLSGQSDNAPNHSLNNVLKFVRDGNPDETTVAWNATIGPVKVPLTADQLAQPGFAARADFIGRVVLSRLFLDDPSLRDAFSNDPTPDDPAFPAIFAEVQGNLLNGDGARSFTTRRAMVDIFKKLQSGAAYDALVQSRAQIATQRASMTSGSPEAELTDDLLSRIDAATHPYFN